ncbi:threonine aldolase family protein [Candidatus Avelusimicrobium gallicola]|uniref:Low specificity L-threonine aldolase n=1 Tax=Candidatus Avelusimicrobium gallicola TaxID=2562704 RepID=A0A1Y4DEQ9_9BACT|nr:low specificity L-threonine aldolase [Elusimicrobium sp. An273]OUO57556.1 low specificity L-threonine aldolase [Elusimicrobium sp. An273]
MIRFNCDYSEGAHPAVLEKLALTNLEQTPGYGQDIYCRRAADLIKNLCAAPDADVHFLMGGTQTNLTVIAACLRPYQGVISATSGHINVHETGAIETTGHRVITVEEQNGKLTAEQIARCCQEHWQDDNPEFAPQPKLVYLSFPTEYGTLYSKAELTAIRRVCDEHNLFLFMDGARLGYGLEAPGNDLTLSDIAACCDVFYIGGTKIGALLGEAVVIVNPKLQKDFRYFMKQKGAMLAKGRVLGLQFLALFENGLYFKISKHADDMAQLIRRACQEAGYSFLYDSPTNQQFPIMPEKTIKQLEEFYAFSHTRRLDRGRAAIRICTSWATREEDVRQLTADIRKYAGK